MYLLLDECCAKSLVAVAEKLGHCVQRTIDVAALGRQAADTDIFAFACGADAIVVTINRGDFIALATRSTDHAGVIILPSVPVRPLAALFEAVLLAASSIFDAERNVFVEIDAEGAVACFRLP
jgi:predicted nuclease of predicted toxin-antitoxin system